MTPEERAEMDSLRRRLRGHEQLASKGIYLTTAEYTRRVAAARELAEALERMQQALDQVMPGIQYISCTDYSVVVEAPLEAASALKDYYNLGPDMPVR